MKNSVKKITLISACVLSAAMCFGSLAACGGAKPEHTDAKAATCTTAGNTEYWVKDGKYYSDEACKNEITEADTVVKALGHDFENGTYVTTDATQHWKVCGRTGCDETSAKENHTIDWNKTEDKHSKGCTVCGKVTVEETNHSYNENGACECGNKSLFADVKAIGENVTTEYATKSVSFSYSSNTALDYDDVSIEIPLKDMELYRYYEVTYVIESEAAGAHLDFYVQSDRAEYVGEYEDFDIVKGVNTITVKFAPTLVSEGVVTTGLTPYDVNVFNLKLTSVTYTVDTGIAKFCTMGKEPDINTKKTDNKDGSFNITGNGDGTDWHLKVEHRINLTQGKTYEMVYVLRTNVVSKSGNLKLEIDKVAGEAVATIANELYWYDVEADGKGSGATVVAKFRFTAEKTVSDHYSNLNIGELTNADNKLDLDVLYVALNEVA